MGDDTGGGPQTGEARSRTDADLISDRTRLSVAFGELFDRHHPEVHRYLTRRAGASVADDLASETFLMAFRSRSGYDRSVPDARPWLLGIATNVLRRHRRDEARHLARMARGVSGADVQAEDHADLVDDQQSARADVARLHGQLSRLRGPDRDTLLLYALGDLTYAQVGAALGVPVGTVRSRLSRCRRLLGAVAQPAPITAPTVRAEVCHE